MVVFILIIVFAVIMIAWAESKDPGGPMPKPPKAPATHREWIKYEKKLHMKQQAIEGAKIRKEIKERVRREREGEDLGENNSEALKEEYRRKRESGIL